MLYADRLIDGDRLGIDGDLIVEHRLIDAFADAFGFGVDLEEVIALDDEAGGLAIANLMDFGDES